MSRATSHGAPWLRWPEDGEEGNGGTPSPGAIEHPLVGGSSTFNPCGLFAASYPARSLELLRPHWWAATIMHTPRMFASSLSDLHQKKCIYVHQQEKFVMAYALWAEFSLNRCTPLFGVSQCNTQEGITMKKVSSIHRASSHNTGAFVYTCVMLSSRY